MEKEVGIGADLGGIDLGEALDHGEHSVDDLAFRQMIVAVRRQEAEGSTVRTPYLRFRSG